MVFITRFLLFSIFIGTVSLETAVSLRCFSCHDDASCLDPFVDDCPADQGVCYTLSDPEGKVVRKGCAKSCEDVNKNGSLTCDSCKNKDYCNGPDKGFGMNVDIEHHRNVDGKNVITNDTETSKFEPNPNDGYQIGTEMTTVNGELNKSNSTLFWAIFWLIVVILVLIIGSITFIIYQRYLKPSDKTYPPVEGQSDELLKDRPFAPPICINLKYYDPN